jgi:hypothetical protein
MVAVWYIAAHVIVHTLGHSTLPLDAFLGLLATHGIAGIVDVRRFPASRRHPHFARDALAASLARPASRTTGCRSSAGGGRHDRIRRTSAGESKDFAATPITWRRASSRTASHGWSRSPGRDRRRSSAPRPCRGDAIAVSWPMPCSLVASKSVTSSARDGDPHHLTEFARLEGIASSTIGAAQPHLPGVS